MATKDQIGSVAAPGGAAAVIKSKKSRKPAAPKKPSPAHPTYMEMIGEAISSLKERTGSSQYAIAKFAEGKHKAKLPPNFKKLLLVQLKKLTAGGKLTKVKNSYKLTSATAKKASSPTAAKPKPSGTAAAAKTKANPSAAAKTKSKAAVKPKERAAASAKAKKPANKVAKPKASAAKALKTNSKASLAKPKKAADPKKAGPGAAKPNVNSVKKVGKSPVKKSPPAKKAKK